MKILLVENEPPLASFVKKGFEHEGYDVTVAYDGRTGWSLYEQHPYDLAILDINLPHVNGGRGAAPPHKGGSQRVPLLLTALDSRDDKEAGFAAGADNYLVKPL